MRVKDSLPPPDVRLLQLYTSSYHGHWDKVAVYSVPSEASRWHPQSVTAEEESANLPLVLPVKGFLDFITLAGRLCDYRL